MRFDKYEHDELIEYSYLRFDEKYIKLYIGKWIDRKITLDEWLSHPEITPYSGYVTDIDEHSYSFTISNSEKEIIIDHMKTLYKKQVQLILNDLNKIQLTDIEFKSHQNKFRLLISKKLSTKEMILLYNDFGIRIEGDYNIFNWNKYSKDEIFSGFNDPEYKIKTIKGELYEPFEELSVTSPNCLAKFEALLKYYKILPKNGGASIPHTIKIKNMPTNPKKKEEIHEALHNIFDAIHQYCIEASWIDFKLIFSQTGSSKKIIWPDNAQVLRFLFTKLGPSLEYTPGRWEAVCHYFKPSENDVFDPKKLTSNSGYKNKTLENLINEFKNTLS